MVVTKKETTSNPKTTIERKTMEQVKKFIFLGYLITENGICDRGGYLVAFQIS